MKNKEQKSYILGFISSIVLTLLAYFVVAEHMLSGTWLILVVIILAVIQFVVQLIFFLHLGEESDPSSRENLAVLLSAVSLILIIVIGSLWIMNNLNYRMTPDQIQQYLQDQGAF